MKKDTYLKTSGLVFALVGLGHLLRILYGWELIIGTWLVPSALSAGAVVITWYLAYSAFKMIK